jgi:hypothetical protein
MPKKENAEIPKNFSVYFEKLGGRSDLFVTKNCK